MNELEKLRYSFLELASYFKKVENYSKLENLLDLCPAEFETEDFVKEIANTIPPKVHNEKSIVYFASFYSPHFEQWNGDSLKVGLGGSESAVIYLAEEWIKLGYSVTVYCDTPNDTIINGVRYLKYWKINWKDLFNIFIIWRTPYFLDMQTSAKKHYVDMHDYCKPEEWTEERCNKVDKVFFKSRWHSEQIPQLPTAKRVVISNGVVL